MSHIHPFAQRFVNLSPEIITLIGQIETLKGQWIGSTQLSPQILGRLRRSVLVTSTGASTRIEGARLSDEQIEHLMQSLSIQTFHNRDEQEATGYYELLHNVFTAWQTLSFTEGLIKHFHHELLKYVEKDALHRGDYKKTENKVHMVNAEGESLALLFDTTPAYLTQEQMQDLLEWTRQALAQRTYHPLLIIGNFLVEFLKIHPFEDGNGRLSRILTNFLLLHEGYAYMPYVSHEKIVEDNKLSYYLALRKSQNTLGTDHEDITPWLLFFFDVLLTQARIAIGLLTKERLEDLLSPAQLTIWQYLQAHGEASPREIAASTHIARPTLNQALTKLLKLAAIERIGEGAAIRYRKALPR
jgi:Fic family protein